MMKIVNVQKRKEQKQFVYISIIVCTLTEVSLLLSIDR